MQIPIQLESIIWPQYNIFCQFQFDSATNHLHVFLIIIVHGQVHFPINLLNLN